MGVGVGLGVGGRMEFYGRLTRENILNIWFVSYLMGWDSLRDPMLSVNDVLSDKEESCCIKHTTCFMKRVHGLFDLLGTLGSSKRWFSRPKQKEQVVMEIILRDRVDYDEL